MSLTRKALVAMGIEAEKIEQIIEMHTEVTEALKAERDTAKEDAKKFKADAEKLATVQAELDTLKAEANKPDAFKVKYEALKEEFDTYKNEQTAKATKDAKVQAFKALLKEIGISEKRIDAVTKVSDIDGIELDDAGNIKDAEAMRENLKSEWGDFITTTGTTGAKTTTPPTNTGGKMTKDEIMNIKDSSERQAAIADNIELFSH